ncbi:MAG TPA: hypothetical protein VK638_08325, partial [Edaphobacter sp.]|nr:hypothetical protein [Edaphobacter sp.]
NVWLLTRDTLIVGRKKAPTLLPLVIQRQQVADALAKYLNILGLGRVSKQISVLDQTERPRRQPPENRQ